MQAQHLRERGNTRFSGQRQRGGKPGRDDSRAALSRSRAESQPVTCFTPGTAITTLTGLEAVENLKVGHRVLTRDRGFQSIRWIGRRQISGKDMPSRPGSLPVLIRADALGPGRPARDIVVSPRHRLLTKEKLLLSGSGEPEGLIESNALVGRPGIINVIPRNLTYIHVLFDQHEVILSDNIWTESFHLDRPAIAALLHAQFSSIREIFPQVGKNLAAPFQETARVCLAHSRDQSHVAQEMAV